MLPHRIRLRGPWQFSPMRPDQTARALRIPEHWDEVAPLYPARALRHFAWPAPLATHERLWLIVEGLATGCKVWLNDHALGGGAGEWDISARARERNELRIDLPAGVRWDEVFIEVRGAAWLSNVVARRHGDRLRLSGQVKGTADHPLDLYAILDRRPVLHSMVEAGGEFAAESGPIAAAGWRPVARVELVCGGTVWHAADVPVAAR